MSALLFVFETICHDDLQFSDDLESYPELLESDWYLFWKDEGEDIVNCSWNKRYSEYIATDEESNLEFTEANALKANEEDCLQKQEFTERNPSNENSEENCIQQILEDQEVADSGSSKNIFENQGVPNASNEGEEGNCLQEVSGTQTWQELWDDHYLSVYENTYRLYQIVHYQHYCFHRPGLVDNFEEPPVNEIEYEVEFINQTDELKALGLPISFGGRGYKHHSNTSDYDIESISEEELEMSPIQEKTIKELPKKKKNRKKKTIPKMIRENKSLSKYWYKRFSLFSRFDEGIQLDVESWFSVTPEKVAVHMARRLACDTIIDGFCGSGGNAIQFASTCSRVIAIDIDPEKIKNARHNASIYGVANKIDFIVGDYLQLCCSLKGDVVFLSPPWGGPKYISAKEYDIEESLVPLGATPLVEKSRQISENIAFFLPKNSNREQIKKLAGVGKRVEMEHNFLNTRLVGLTAIYGDWLIDKKNLNV